MREERGDSCTAIEKLRVVATGEAFRAKNCRTIAAITHLLGQLAFTLSGSKLASLKAGLLNNGE